MFTDWFYKKLYQAASWIHLILFGAIMFLLANMEIKDLDLWLHLASGRFILEHFSIPSVDFLSHTMAGQPWNNHEWFFQIVITQVYQLFGVEGWITLRVVLLFLILFHLFIIGYDSDRPFWPVVLLSLTVLVFSERLNLRPELFSLLFFVMFVHILSSALDKRKTIFSLALIQILWVNTHGFFIFGILLVGLLIAGDYLKRFLPLPAQSKSVGRLTLKELKNLKFIFLAVCAACFINPNFIEGAVYPFKVLFSVGSDAGIFFDQIVELQKPITWETLFSWHPYPVYRWMILIPGVSFILNRRHLDIGAFLLWIIFLLLSLSAARNIVFYTVVAYFVTLINLMSLKWEHAFPIKIENKKFIHFSAFLVLSGFILWSFQICDGLMIRGYYDFDRMERKSERGGVSQRNFAHKAVNFLKRENIKGNLLNDFNSGAYLLGRLHPDIRVFIDGRTEVYGPQFFKEYKKVWRGHKDSLDKALNTNDIPVAFLNSVYVAPPKKLVRYFDRHPDWHLVYFDHDAMIYLKATPQHQPIIAAHEINLGRWQAPSMDLFTMEAMKLDPYRQLLRAETLIHLEKYGPARDELQIAQMMSPQYSQIYNLEGQIDFENGHYNEALILFRKALAIKPQNDKARYNYAKTFYFLGRPKEAQTHFKRVLKKHPDYIPARFYLALIDIQAKGGSGSADVLARVLIDADEKFPGFLQDQPVGASLKRAILAKLKEQAGD